MKLSTRSRYATRAMLEITRNYEAGPVKRREITASQQISPHYLENILIPLKDQGLIESVRGPRGGFILKRPPEQITMFEIITALEGSIVPVPCVDSPDSCDKTAHCLARKFWIELHDTQAKFLKSTTLRSLLDLETSGHQIAYYI